ncbi:MAG: type II secretion system F family protein [Armatimonadota bacterium]
MPAFWYTTEASSQRQIIEAESLPQALLRLRERGAAVLRAGRLPTAEREWPHVPWRSLIAVYEQLAATVEQGAPLDRGLRAIAAESADTQLSTSLRALATDLEEGRTLSEAMALQPRTYTPEVVAAVRAGEEGGDLADALRRLARSQRRIAQIASGMAFPLVYPLLVAVIAVGILGFVAAFIFPKFMQLFLDLGMEKSDFPAPTRAVMKIVDVIPIGLVILALIVGFAVVLWLWMRRTEQGRFNLGLARLRIPIFGDVSIYTDLARVSQTLSLLLAGGVEAVRSLRISRDAAQEPALELALRRASLAVEEGGTIAEGLRETELLPDEFVFRLGVAEVQGELPAVLQEIADEYVSHASRLGRKWVIVAGPITVVLLALFIGIVGISMFLPLVGIISNLSQ